TDASCQMAQYKGNDTDEMKMKLTIQIRKMLYSVASSEIRTNYYRLNGGVKLLQLLDEFFEKETKEHERSNLPTLLLLWNLNFQINRLPFTCTNCSTYSVMSLFNFVNPQHLSLPFAASSSEFKSISTLMNQRGCLPMTIYQLIAGTRFLKTCPFTIMTLSMLL
ncbi:hypothetical protein BC830DRAFT_1092809, partial [Chytriomyces sp. MP71]